MLWRDPKKNINRINKNLTKISPLKFFFSRNFNKNSATEINKAETMDLDEYFATPLLLFLTQSSVRLLPIWAPTLNLYVWAPNVNSVIEKVSVGTYCTISEFEFTSIHINITSEGLFCKKGVMRREKSEKAKSSAKFQHVSCRLRPSFLHRLSSCTCTQRSRSYTSAPL